MIGQKELQDKLNKLTLDTFPRSLILCGDRGCGKNLFTDEIAGKLHLNVEDITDNLSIELIDEIYTRVEPKIYTVDATKISVKDQNAILKFLEEPLKNSYIVLHIVNKNQLLNTILNRCQVWSFKPYTDCELRQICKTIVDPSFLTYAKTPGRLNVVMSQDITAIDSLCKKIITSVRIANTANVLSISDKLAYKCEQDKFDIDLFVDVLKTNVLTHLIETNRDSSTYFLFNLVKELKENLLIPNINKQYLIENFLITLKIGCNT